MTTEQLVEDLRQQGITLHLRTIISPDKPTVYTARFWYDGAHIDNPWDKASTFDKAVRLAAIRVIAQCDLDVTVPKPKSGLRDLVMFVSCVSVGYILAEYLRAIVLEAHK